MLAYGWTYKNLSRCKSNVMALLSKYVDRGLLACGTLSPPRQIPEPEPSRKRRRLEDSDESRSQVSSHSVAMSRGINSVEPLIQSVTVIETGNGPGRSFYHSSRPSNSPFTQILHILHSL